MSQYYYINAQGTQVGPTEASQLTSVITSKTLVWREGMTNWVPAGTIPELAALVPPSIPVPGSASPQSAAKPQSYMWLGILTTLLCCLPCGIISIVYASKVDSSWAAGNYDEAKQNSSYALNYSIVSAIAGVIAYIFAIICVLLSE